MFNVSMFEFGDHSREDDDENEQNLMDQGVITNQYAAYDDISDDE